ncbi:tail fiber protein, partial [Escherichia coli]
MFFSGLFQRKSDAPVTTPAELADAIGLSYDTYTVSGSGSSYIVAHFYTGIGSCRSFQLRADYRNKGLYYRSSRDTHGF